MLELKNVTMHYGRSPVLKNVSMSIRRGEIVVVMGPNGMGKTTMLSVMAGMHSPIEGVVLVEGKVRRSSPEAEIEIRRKVFYLEAESFLPTYATGREFILAVGRMYDLPDRSVMKHAEDLIELFNLKKVADRPMRTYSSGQRKKISLATALISERPYLILDEPFSGGLDSSGLLAIQRVLRALADRDGRTIVLATPVPELVESVADRIAVLDDGQLVAFETVDGLRRKSDCQGTLSEVLERLIAPQTLQHVDSYLGRRE